MNKLVAITIGDIKGIGIQLLIQLVHKMPFITTIFFILA